MDADNDAGCHVEVGNSDDGDGKTDNC